MKKSTFNSIVTAAALGLTLGLSGHASAEQIQEQAALGNGVQVKSISIPYKSGDLTSDAGRANLYGRIKSAAKEVCGPTGLLEAGGLRIASRNRKCYEAALDEAVSQLESRQVATLAH